MERTATVIMEAPAAASPQSASEVWGRLLPAHGSLTQGEIELRGDDVVLGRAADLPAACTFKDKRISSRHCKIYRDAEQRIWIEDSSANGTFINGAKVGKGEKRQMQMGDLLALASVERQAKKEEAFHAYVLEMPRMNRAESSATEPDALDSTLVDEAVISPIAAPPARTRSMTRQNSKSAEVPLVKQGSMSGKDRKRKAGEAEEGKDGKEARKDEVKGASNAKPPAINVKDSEEENVNAVLEAMETELTCTICQELYYRAVSVLPCLHNFCAPCYGAWMKRSKQCPICRAKVKSVQINHSMRNMLATYLKQYPTRARDPGSLLDLDANGPLTDEMLREGKLRMSSQRDAEDQDDEEDEDGSSDSNSEDEDNPRVPGYVPPVMPFAGALGGMGFAGFGYGGGYAPVPGAFAFAPAPAAVMRCRQCLVAGPDAYRCNLDGSARHFFCKACYKPFPDRSSNPPPNAAPYRCEFCNGCFCNAYWGCTSAMGKGIGKLSELALPDDVPVTSFGGNPEERAVLKTIMQAQGKTADQAFKAVLAAFDAGTLNYAHNGRAVSSKSISCEACEQQIWAALAYEYRTKIVKKEELPADIAARPDCHWGKNCRTVTHNLAHAKRFNHVCDQTKFS